jgi:DNA-binding NtrC family response regulator
MNYTQVIEKQVEYLPVIYLTRSMQELYRQGKKLVGGQRGSILITGEQGTGRELLAKSIHYTTAPGSPFYTINCLNLPFDHFQEKIDQCRLSIDSGGACADNDHGAHAQSTLFLRDFSKLEQGLQNSLLAYLRQQIYPGEAAKQSHPRLMFSWHTNGSAQDVVTLLDTAAAEFFNPCQLSVLPLRDRKDDIRPLALFFMDKFSKEYGHDIGGIHSAALKVLEAYPWPGNVSELRDIIENAVLLAQSPMITKEDIRFNISKKSIALESFLSREDFFTLEELERIYIQTVVRRVKNNKSKAAKILGMARNTLQRRLEAFSSEQPPSKQKKKTVHQPTLF